MAELKELRKFMGITQKELADKRNPCQTYSKIGNGSF